MLAPCLTAVCRNSSMSGDMEPKRIRSSPASLRLRNLRIVMLGPFSASGGITALTREPSARRASTMGELSSMRRPIGATMRSIAPSTARSSVKMTGDRVSRPSCSTKISLWQLTMISDTVGSAISSSSGPSPMISSNTLFFNVSSGTSVEWKLRSWVRISSSAALTVLRNSSSSMRATFRRRRSSAAITFMCACLRNSMPSGLLIGAMGNSAAAVRLACVAAMRSRVSIGGWGWARGVWPDAADGGWSARGRARAALFGDVAPRCVIAATGTTMLGA